MTAAVQRLLENFDHLPEPDKQEAAAEVLRRATMLKYPLLSDDDLTQIADQQFLALERDEQHP